LLSRLTLAFFALSAAIGIAACSSYSSATIGGNGIGPNFPSQTVYATVSNRNSVDIYNKGQKSGSGPAYRISTNQPNLNGPQYVAFDSGKNLWVTNYNASTGSALLVEIAALATGNVLALQSTAVTGRPRGIAITPKATATPTAAAMAVAFAPFAKKSPSPSPSPTLKPVKAELMVISDVDPTQVYPNQLLLYIEGGTAPYQSIAGPNPNLNVPGGVALDKDDNIYVANLQGARVDKFVLPTPSPTPKPTPKPSPTPTTSPSPTPTGSASPSPTPSPTPTPINVRPTFSIIGSKTHVLVPTSVAVDAAGNLYISDQGAPHAKCSSTKGAAVLIFARPRTKGVISSPPTHVITGCQTELIAPTDIKVDSSGLIYVADTTQSGDGIVYVFQPGTYGNVKPMGFYTSTGAVTGLAVVP